MVWSTVMRLNFSDIIAVLDSLHAVIANRLIKEAHFITNKRIKICQSI